MIVSPQNGTTMFGRRSGSSAQIVLLSTFYLFLISLFTRIISAMIIYDKRTLLDIEHRYTNLLQDTLSTNPTWPLEILWDTEEIKGHLNKPRRRKFKKHCGKRAGNSNYKDILKSETVGGQNNLWCGEPTHCRIQRRSSVGKHERVQRIVLCSPMCSKSR